MKIRWYYEQYLYPSLALEEGVSEFFGILAASPAWLNYTHIMDNSTDTEQHLIVSLMITALNTLPRLAYYMSADEWRINAIEMNITNSEDLVSSWWKYRYHVIRELISI